MQRSSVRARVTVIAIVAAFGTAVIGAGPPWAGAASTAQSASEQTVVGSRPSLPAGAHPSTATLPGSLHSAVVLRPSDPADLQSFATSVSTPGSASYRQFLTPTEAQARFGPSPAVITGVRQWLSSTGLSVGATEGDGTLIPINGSPDQLETAFDTTLQSYRLSSGRTAYANTSAPRVPSTVAPGIASVVGLDDLHPDMVDLPAPRSHASSGSSVAVSPAVSAHGSTAGPVPCAAATTAASKLLTTINTTTGAAATADQVASAFDYTALYAKGDLGQGTTVGIFMGGEDYKDSDLQYFQHCYGLDGSVTRVAVNGGSAGVSSGSSIEVTMDIEAVSSLAPDADVVVYEAPSLGNATTLALFATAVQDDQAQVLTASFAGCELYGNDLYAENTLFEEMAAQGQSMFAGSGDQGAQSCLTALTYLSPAVFTSTGASDPASQPFVTAVGGVHINDLSTPATTTSVWDWGPYSHWVGNVVSGGGPSGTWAMPSWQVGADHSDNDHQTCGPSFTTPCREVPDVAGNATFRNGEGIYCTVQACITTYETGTGESDPAPGWFAGGGTSYASPQWAALAALIDEGVPGGRVGLFSPLLYQVDSADPSAFVDVVTGNNAYLTPTNTYSVAPPTCTYATVSGQPCYEATPGYDMASGLGIPVAGVLAPAVQALAVPPFSITTTSLPGATVGSPYSATVTAIGGTAPYRWSIGNGALPSGLSLDPSTGAISGTATAAGTASFVVDAADSTVGVARTGTAVLSISVGQPAPPGAAFFGSMGGKPLAKPIVGLAGTPDGQGYWEVAADGGIFAFGDASFYGSMGGIPLNKPITGIASTPDGRGYWEVASDGGIFSFGDAQFYGSMGGKSLNAPIAGLAATPSGLGYWEVASDGGIFAFGDATFYGSAAGLPLAGPIVGVSASSGGYQLVAADGGIFTFGHAPFYGSAGGLALAEPIVGVATVPGGGGYWEVASDGGVFAFPGG